MKEKTYVLKSIETNEYWGADGNETENLFEAIRFKSRSRASDFALSEQGYGWVNETKVVPIVKKKKQKNSSVQPHSYYVLKSLLYTKRPYYTYSGEFTKRQSQASLFISYEEALHEAQSEYGSTAWVDVVEIVKITPKKKKAEKPKQTIELPSMMNLTVVDWLEQWVKQDSVARSVQVNFNDTGNRGNIWAINLYDSDNCDADGRWVWAESSDFYEAAKQVYEQLNAKKSKKKKVKK